MAARFFSKMFSAARARVFSAKFFTSNAAEVNPRFAYVQRVKKLEREIKVLEKIKCTPPTPFSLLATGLGVGVPVVSLYAYFSIGWYPKVIQRWPALENYLKEMPNKMLEDTKDCSTCNCSCGAT